MTLYIVLGLLMSSLTRQSSTSFLLSLVLWVVTVLVIPRAGVLAAGQIMPVPGLAEIEGRRESFAHDKRANYMNELAERSRIRNNERRADDTELDEAAMWADMKFEDSIRREMQIEIDNYDAILKEDWQNRKAAQQKLGFALSRISPASTYHLATMSLAETDISTSPRYLEAMQRYRQQFIEYAEKKQDENGQMGGVMINMDSEKGLTISSSRDNAGLDISDRPRFSFSNHSLSVLFSSMIVDIALLLVSIFLAFSITFVRFLRYDVR